MITKSGSIGIVIPAYNAGLFLGATLQGVLSQTLTEWELVVVDDGSTDGSVAMVQQLALTDKRFRVIRQRNGGTARARNAGLAALSHKVEYVAFLDHDDVWGPHTLGVLRETLEANPNAPAAHGLARKVDAEGRPLADGPAGIQNYDRKTMRGSRLVTADRTAATTAAMVIYDNLICTPGAALIRRSALREIGEPVFDPSAAPLDDWDFWIRLSFLGDLAFVDRLVIDWRRHAAAGSHDAEAMCAAELRIRERLLASQLPEELMAIAQARYARLTATNVRREARNAWREARTGESVKGYARYLGLRVLGGMTRGTGHRA